MQKQKAPQNHCDVCGKKIREQHHRICRKCNEMLGEGYEVKEILQHYRGGKQSCQKQHYVLPNLEVIVKGNN